MALLQNNSHRSINIGGVLLLPGTVANVDDDLLDNPRVQELFEEDADGHKVLEKVTVE